MDVPKLAWPKLMYISHGSRLEKFRSSRTVGRGRAVQSVAAACKRLRPLSGTIGRQTDFDLTIGQCLVSGWSVARRADQWNRVLYIAFCLDVQLSLIVDRDLIRRCACLDPSRGSGKRPTALVCTLHTGFSQVAGSFLIYIADIEFS